eukprot:1451702-Amphidinium_carterae.2
MKDVQVQAKPKPITGGRANQRLTTTMIALARITSKRDAEYLNGGDSTHPFLKFLNHHVPVQLCVAACPLGIKTTNV